MAQIKSASPLKGMKKQIEALNEFLQEELSDWSDMAFDYEVHDKHNGIVYFEVTIKHMDEQATFNCRVNDEDFNVEIEMGEGNYYTVCSFDHSIRNFWIIVAPQIFPV